MADARSLFQVVIEAIDRVSAPVEKMAAAIHKIGAPVREVGDHLEHLGHASGVEHIAEKFGELRESIGGAAERLVEFLGPLAALTAIGSLAGLGELVVHVAETGEQLERTSKIIGITVEQLQELHYAATQTGTPIEAMDKGIEMLNRRLGDAARGKNKDLIGLLAKMPGALNAQHKPMLNAAQMLPLISDLYARNANAATRAAIANALFGRAGQQLTPIFAAGRDALEKWADEQREAGELTGKQTAAAKEFAEGYKALKSSVTGLADQIGVRLMPILRPLLDGLRKWLNANREIIAGHIEQAVKRLTDELARVDWVKFLKGLEDTAGKIGALIDKTVGWQGALALLAAFMLSPFIAAIVAVGEAIVGVGAAILATPIGWILAGLALLVVAGYELVKHWDDVKQFFVHLWDNSAFFRMFVILNPIGQLVLAGIWLADNWDAIESRLKGAVDGIVAALHLLDQDPLFHAIFATGGYLLDADALARKSVGKLLTDINPFNYGDAFKKFNDSSAFGGIPRWEESRDNPADKTGGLGGDLLGYAGKLNRIDGSVDVNVYLPNAPPGTRVTTQSRGPVVPKARVGINMTDDDNRE